ncbi:RagB/SusD family nutrient uptake outer membrane protein [Pedobacter sp. MC2016-14]|uniref:RagB/SusD family nutrient uptake outer membrane protein n=1 Tax=Pedobacter sp. MC2016-14 TaxID=2897327 RepID=UPI001E4F2F6B|nr:RagB/SusD family nutrient uptake outer membrane protein [Pedobacter sp. MC2016-14]MCD0488237.1 RagB/SusD family nutrient uptake outer membrane protein [Pedobacter sp. MC2016-14]
MRNLFKRYVYIVLVLVTAASCAKLDQKPTDTISPEQAYRNLNDINMGLLGAYGYMDYTLIATSIIVADEATYPGENTVGNKDAFKWQYTPSSGSVTSAYGEYYVVIDRLNRVLQNIDRIEVSSTEQVIKDRYKGELLALRAYCHFELIRGYASAYQNGALGVPYMKQSIIGFPARDPFESVVANAKADLVAAKALIPSTFTDKTRITKIGVSAIQARLALYEKNWSEAITYSTEVINAVPLATKVQFPGIWTDANKSEVIWELNRRVGSTATGSNIGGFFLRQTPEMVLYAPSFKLINSFDQTNDIRYPAYIRFDATRTGTRSQYLVNKYVGGSTVPGLADIKLFRTGEMYLIRAEARAESSGDAAGDLNTLRAARINGYVNETFPTGTLITAIYAERFKELAFEGHRFFDLRRRNLNVNRSGPDAVNTEGANILTSQQAQYALPLPADEIFVNKQTIQNPYYDK